MARHANHEDATITRVASTLVGVLGVVRGPLADRAFHLGDLTLLGACGSRLCGLLRVLTLLAGLDVVTSTPGASGADLAGAVLETIAWEGIRVGWGES